MSASLSVRYLRKLVVGVHDTTEIIYSYYELVAIRIAIQVTYIHELN